MPPALRPNSTKRASSPCASSAPPTSRRWRPSASRLCSSLATPDWRTPADLPEIAGQRTIGLEVTQPIPVGDGAAMLARRPDIQAAEAASCRRPRRGSAWRRPTSIRRISLGGSIGSTGPNIADAFGAGPFRWLVGPLISWTFPNRARPARASTKRRPTARRPSPPFDGTVLNALQETETALTVYARALDRPAVAAIGTEFRGAGGNGRARQQKEGAIDGLQLLDTERTFSEAHGRACAAGRAGQRGARSISSGALGGGWAKS